MIPILIDGPAVEPVSVPEMRAYLRREDGAEDDLLAGLIKAARLMVEAASRRILVAQRWQVVLDRWPPGRVIDLPLAPLMSVDRVRLYDPQDAGADVPLGSVDLDPMADPPRLIVDDAVPEPGRARRGIAIDLWAGFGAAAEDVPASLRLAVKIMVAHWFENRGDVAGAQTLPPQALALVAPFQGVRL